MREHDLFGVPWNSFISASRSGHCPDSYHESERTVMEYVTIMEAARRCGMSDKTIQRAIRAGVLTARYPQPNRCEIAVSDLETFKLGHVPGPVQTTTESRLVTLEARVQQLEHLVEELLSRQEAPKPQRSVKV